MSWATAYVGREWTPDYDCWALVRDVQAREFGRAVPTIDVDSSDHGTRLKTFASHPERQRWLEVPAPQPGDAVLLGRGRHPSHVGVWTDGGRVLHSIEGAGVVCQTVAQLHAMGWRRILYYRWTG